MDLSKSAIFPTFLLVSKNPTDTKVRVDTINGKLISKASNQDIIRPRTPPKY
jgi:hypothetical protein